MSTAGFQSRGSSEEGQGRGRGLPSESRSFESHTSRAAYGYGAWGYFVLAAVLGGMFVVNLFLAVIFDEFMRRSEDARQQNRASRAKGSAGLESRTGGEGSAGGESSPGGVGGGIGRGDPAVAWTTQAAGRDGAAEGGDNTDGPATLLIRRDTIPSDGSTHGDFAAASEDDPPWRSRLRSAMLSSALGHASTVLILFNLLLMCLPYADQPPEWGALIEGLSSAVTWIFIVEMALKLLSLGCAGYWDDGWNKLDGSIVSLSVVEMIVTALLAGNGVNVSFLRMLRLLRLLRLLKAWPGLFKIVMAFARAVPQIANLFLLMVLVMAIFSLLGMQVTGYRSPCPRHPYPRSLLASHLSPLTLTSPSPSFRPYILTSHASLPLLSTLTADFWRHIHLRAITLAL